MYRPNEVSAQLKGIWGWRQNQNSDDFEIASSLTQTSTGQYFQDVHPLLTLDNIKAIAPRFSEITYPAWDQATTYQAGTKVTYNTVNYRSLSESLNAQPDANPLFWETYDTFSEWLEEKTNASILKALRRFWDEKMVDKNVKNLLENKTLFNGAGRISDLIPTGSNLVGFEIVPIRANGITTKLEKIGLQMTGQSNVRMYLMHSSRKDPIRVLDFQRIRDGGMQWFDLTDVFLPYSGPSIDAGGSWYLVYNQDELPEGVQAVNKNKDWSKKPCSTCDRQETAAYEIWSRYLEIHPFKVSDFVFGEGDYSGDFNGDFNIQAIELWDIADNLYTYSSNWGLNLQISVECDITDILSEQKDSFQNVIGYQVGCDFIREFAYNPNFRINRSQQNFSRMELLYELDGDSQSYKKTGLVNSLNTSMEALKLDFSKMSKVCFPCNNRGLKFRSI